MTNQSTTRACQECGEAIPSHLRKGTKFCSKTCQTRDASRRYQRKIDPEVKKQRFAEWYNKTGRSAAAEAWAETRSRLDEAVEVWMYRLEHHYDIKTADDELKQVLRDEIELLPSLVREHLEYHFFEELGYE